MKKHLLCLAILLVSLVAWCVGAGADAVVTSLSSQEEIGSAHGGISLAAAGETASSSYYSGDHYYPNRGETVKLWWWNDSTNGYNLKDGKKLNYFYYDYYGNITVTVTKGTSWLGLRGKASDWEWVLRSTNTSSKTREGQITIKDSRGTVLIINIKQAGKPDIKSLKRQKSKKLNKLTLKTIKDVDGYIIYCAETKSDYVSSYNYDIVGRTKGSTFKHQKAKAGYLYSYKIAPYIKINGVEIVGPATKVVSVDAR